MRTTPMSSGPSGYLIRFIRKVAGAGDGAAATDGQLLERFVSAADQRAFEILLDRYGPMVLGLCRRLLRDPHEAEDAFQATFLVLARKARSLSRPERVGSWLYGVAYRTALKARAGAARKRAQETPVMDVAAPEPADQPAWKDLLPYLDDEVSRLPEKYRLPVVHCYLRGQTYAEAARALGWAEGTVSSRLARARERLRKRLARRGVAVSAGAVAAALAGAEASAAVPAALLQSTARAAAAVAAGRGAEGVVSTKVLTLTQGVLKTMFATQLKMTAAVLVALGLVGTGGGVLWRQAAARGLGDEPAQAKTQTKPKPAEKPEVKAAASQPKPDDGQPRAAINSATQMRAALAKPATLAIDANTQLKDALDMIQDQLGMTILVDNEAFKEEGVPEVEQQPVRLPKLTNVKWRTILRLLLSQVQGDFLLRDGVVMVVPRGQVAAGRPLKTPVDVSFKDIPLDMALQELSDLSGVSIVLDSVRGANQPNDPRKAAVTATFDNVPLEAAVAVLADMGGMAPVVMDNVIYVTERGNAELLAEQRKKQASPAGEAPPKEGTAK